MSLRRKRKSQGAPPPDGDLIGAVAGWDVYRRPNDGVWVNLKVVHPGNRTGRANLWLGYDPGAGRFAHVGDYHYLIANVDEAPELLAGIRRLLAPEPEGYRTVEDLL